MCIPTDFWYTTTCHVFFPSSQNTSNWAVNKQRFLCMNSSFACLLFQTVGVKNPKYDCCVQLPFCKHNIFFCNETTAKCSKNMTFLQISHIFPSNISHPFHHLGHPSKTLAQKKIDNERRTLGVPFCRGIFGVPKLAPIMPAMAIPACSAERGEVPRAL